MKVLLLKLEAPMMSFGDIAIDERRGTDRHPLKSMIVGLLANAIGLRRTSAAEIQHLQEAITVASRLDRPGIVMEDYQTAIAGTGTDKDAKKSFLSPRGWSSRGYLMGRSNTNLTYQIWKEYRADASVTVAISAPGTIFDRLVDAVRKPVRPIFLGRKGCLPTRPIFDTVVEAEDVADALFRLPDGEEGQKSVRWPAELGAKNKKTSRLTLCDLRDWANGVPSGQRDVFEAMIEKGASS